MRSKDPEMMKEILEFAERFYLTEGRSPSTAEISAEVGFSRTAVYRYLVEMDEKGMLSYDSGRISTPLIDRYDSQRSEVPICGSIPCGDPMEEVESIERIVSLPTKIFGSGPLFILKATGDSMVDVGIEDGDYVVIRQTHEAAVGDIVVALDQHGQNTLKTYGGVDGETRKAILLYRNEAVYGNKRILVSELVIQGVAKHVIKAL